MPTAEVAQNAPGPPPAPPIRSVKYLKVTTRLHLPSGIVAEVRRPPLSVMVAGGRLPDSLLSAIASARDGSVEVVASELELPPLMAFAIELAKASFVWPRIVDVADPEDDDTIEPGHLSLDDLSTFLSWVFGGADGVPIQTKTGEVSAAALRSFRDDTELSGAGADGREVRQESGA